MHHVEVEVIELEISERLLAGGDNVVFAVFVVPELGGDPELLAAQPAAKELPEDAPDPVFVAIHRCAVEVPVTDACGIAHGLSHGIVRNMIRTERPQADRGDSVAGSQSPARDKRRIHGLDLQAKLGCRRLHF